MQKRELLEEHVLYMIYKLASAKKFSDKNINGILSKFKDENFVIRMSPLRYLYVFKEAGVFNELNIEILKKILDEICPIYPWC